MEHCPLHRTVIDDPSSRRYGNPKGLQTPLTELLAHRLDDFPTAWDHLERRAPPAALYYASRDRKQEHPERHLQSLTGILRADAYSGYVAPEFMLRLR
jgi:hypothetical protein